MISFLGMARLRLAPFGARKYQFWTASIPRNDTETQPKLKRAEGIKFQGWNPARTT
jgi:hypothetical protein